MASSSSTSAALWDVFLSFRGTDTRMGFTSHLYNSLQRHTGIRTFIDETGLQGGDIISPELRHAIKQSKLYIVVLSENYASSGWCLDELVEILECWKSFGRLVLPIFYKIDPSVVRYQLWKFGEAFGKHESRVERKIVNNWRNAMRKVGDFSGYHVRTEADIINEVVDRVLQVVNPVTLDVAQHPVGLNSRVASLKSLLDSSSTINGVNWIGIHGMGGVGKTTLAKAFYNQMSGNFDSSCFLADIKDVGQVHKGLESLQQQLIYGVRKRKNSTTINNIYEGISTIEKQICPLKVLVVLDDIDHQDQVNYLVGKFLAAAGSVIVLTTRNEDLLDSFKVEAKYKVNILDADESRQLFNQHALEDPEVEVSSEVIVMSDEILRHAEGLPLALTVFGSILFNQEKDKWAWFVDRLQRAPINDVEKKLTISVEALKQIDNVIVHPYPNQEQAQDFSPNIGQVIDALDYSVNNALINSGGVPVQLSQGSGAGGQLADGNGVGAELPLGVKKNHEISNADGDQVPWLAQTFSHIGMTGDNVIVHPNPNQEQAPEFSLNFNQMIDALDYSVNNALTTSGGVHVQQSQGSEAGGQLAEGNGVGAELPHEDVNQNHENSNADGDQVPWFSQTFSHIVLTGDNVIVCPNTNQQQAPDFSPNFNQVTVTGDNAIPYSNPNRQQATWFPQNFGQATMAGDKFLPSSNPNGEQAAGFPHNFGQETMTGDYMIPFSNPSGEKGTGFAQNSGQVNMATTSMDPTGNQLINGLYILNQGPVSDFGMGLSPFGNAETFGNLGEWTMGANQLADNASEGMACNYDIGYFNHIIQDFDAARGVDHWDPFN